MQNFFATITPQILESSLDEITRLIVQMKLTNGIKVRLINVKTLKNGSITGRFLHDKNLFFQVHFNFIVVCKKGFICDEFRYKVLCKQHTDLIFPLNECKETINEDDRCCCTPSFNF